MDIEEAFKSAKKLILEAGEKTMEFYGTDYEVEKKDDNTPLTEADLAANRIIMEGLRENFPDCGFLTEEEKDDPERLEKDYVWIVDPIDGTKEFIRQTGEFTINIALVHRGRPVIGLVYLPAKDTLYYGVEGQGAYREKESKERIRVSDRKEFSNMILTRSRSHASDKEKELEEEFSDCIPAGSSMKGCLVAEGKADVYVREHPVNEWDICAMECVVSEAGGKMTDFNGEKRKYNSKDTLLNGFAATNGKKHEEILKKFKKNP